LSDAEIDFLRNAERKTACLNLGEICDGGCKGVFCNADNSSIAQILWDNEEITVLPDSFSSLTGLKVLSLSGNSLENIPPISSLVALESINIASNKLSYFPDISSLTNLESLALSDNNINELPQGISSLKSLSFFSIDKNCLDCNTIKSKLPSHIKIDCAVSYPEKCASPSSSESSWSSSSSGGKHGLGPMSYVALIFAAILVVGVFITCIVLLVKKLVKNKNPQHGYQPITPDSNEDVV